jgi:hypothetical protein
MAVLLSVSQYIGAKPAEKAERYKILRSLLIYV